MEREALMRTIIENPDDDVARLVFADWLEENGESERAEFIRLDIHLHDVDRGDPLYHAQRRRWGQLLEQYEKAWKGQLPALPNGLLWGNTQRGFVDEILVGFRDHRGPAAPIPQAEVTLRRIYWRAPWYTPEFLVGEQVATVREWHIEEGHRGFSDGSEYDRCVSTWIGSGNGASMIHLWLHAGNFSIETVQTMADASWPCLRTFRWWNEWNVTNGFCHPLYTANWLNQLTHLEWKGGRFSEEDLNILCRHLNRERLRHLAFRHCSLTDQDADVLASSGLLAGLNTLDLTWNQIGPKGVKRILRELPERARVIFDQNPIGDEGFIALADSPLLARLSELRIERMGVTGDSLSVLSQSPSAANLTALEFAAQGIDSDGADALFRSPFLTQLESLDLSANRITSLPPLRFPRMEVLNLGGNPLTAQAVETLCTMAEMPVLTQLHLDGVSTASLGITALMSNTVFPTLRWLTVSHCGIDDAILESWFDSPRLRSLEWIQFQSQEKPISPELFDAFARNAEKYGCVVDRNHPREVPNTGADHGT